MRALLILGAIAGCGAPPAGAPATFSITSDPVVAPAGSEATLCWFAQLPPRALAVTRFEVSGSAGTHHLSAFVLDGDGFQAGAADCPPDGELTQLLVGAQGQDFSLRLPDGVALIAPASAWIALQHHVVNATTTDEQVSATITLEEGPDGLTPAGWWVGDYAGAIDVPPHGDASYSAACDGVAGSFVMLSSHAHQHLTRFDATLGASAIYQSMQWDAPLVDDLTASPLELDGTQPLGWSCAYHNDGDTAVHQGGSALTDEMCLLVGLYYPAPSSTTVCTSP